MADGASWSWSALRPNPVCGFRWQAKGCGALKPAMLAPAAAACAKGCSSCRLAVHAVLQRGKPWLQNAQQVNGIQTSLCSPDPFCLPTSQHWLFYEVRADMSAVYCRRDRRALRAPCLLGLLRGMHGFAGVLLIRGAWYSHLALGFLLACAPQHHHLHCCLRQRLQGAGPPHEVSGQSSGGNNLRCRSPDTRQYPQGSLI